jgi:hypothetical protein
MSTWNGVCPKALLLLFIVCIAHNQCLWSQTSAKITLSKDQLDAGDPVSLDLTFNEPLPCAVNVRVTFNSMRAKNRTRSIWIKPAIKEKFILR